MARFLAKLLLFSAVLALATMAALRGPSQRAVDTFYWKFTTPARSLILGSSRALQSLDPAIIALDARDEGPLLNFAFTIANSPYGPVYLRAISRKVPASVRRGVFLLEVNPLLVSINAQEREDAETFRERHLTLDRQGVFTLDPNYDYLLRNFRSPLYRLLGPPLPSREHPQRNGWLQLSVPMDAPTLAARRKRGIEAYAGVFQQHRLSPLRIEWLRKTIAFLHEHGSPMLVRLPTSPEMAALEAAYAPDFDTLMAGLAAETGAAYLNLLPESATFETTDGNHLSVESARRCSQRVGAELRGLPRDGR